MVSTLEYSRDLKAKYSSSKSYRPSSYKKTYKKTTYTKKTYTYKYSTYKNTRVYSNGSWDGYATYGPLYTYYLPVGLYFAVGYYSYLYGRTYYDGYGYNFYYKKYGYYEYSVNET